MLYNKIYYKNILLLLNKYIYIYKHIYNINIVFEMNY